MYENHKNTGWLQHIQYTLSSTFSHFDLNPGVVCDFPPKSFAFKSTDTWGGYPCQCCANYEATVIESHENTQLCHLTCYKGWGSRTPCPWPDSEWPIVITLFPNALQLLLLSPLRGSGGARGLLTSPSAVWQRSNDLIETPARGQLNTLECDHTAFPA